jgi:flagellar protein FlaD
LKRRSIPLSKRRVKRMSLTQEQIEERLAPLRSKIPSIVLDRVAERLRDERITEEDLEELTQRLVESYAQPERELETIEKRLEKMESTISSLEEFLRSQMRREGEGVKRPERETAIEERKIESERLKEEREEIKVLKKERMPKEIVKEKIQYVEEIGPRLRKIAPNLVNDIVVMRWIEFMIERVGRENLPGLLEYYVDINWISEDVMNTILNYARGFSSQKESYEVKRLVDLNATDHIRSLLFIEKLRGKCINRALLMSLEREIAKIQEESTELYGI